ncbi:flagellar associated protein [Dorcoceras hygrometricum]|uniref:Flagellar associated protein n=1 Tax=Dorcoceras hygrometricum TaxID=472368 RepID=A0A2Z7CES6_9LAMI|nr:flagellar associated protein [Dorcoceras hygrometricum]
MGNERSELISAESAEYVRSGYTQMSYILLPTTAAPATDLSEQFAQLRASISQQSIKQMRTQISIGNMQNHLLSRINDLEKASANARTQKDQDLQGAVMTKMVKVAAMVEVSLLLKIEANLDLEMVVVVVAEVSFQGKEEAVVLNKRLEILDLG